MPCNHAPEIQTLRYLDERGERQKFMIRCRICLKSGPIRGTQEEATLAWNAQNAVPAPPVALTVEKATH
jgi:hypothetical protein